MMQIRSVLFSDVHSDIPHGSILLWKCGRFRDGPFHWLINRLISRPDRSDWSHIGRVQRDEKGRLWSLEFLQCQGPVCKRLYNYVEQYPGRIDVFAPSLQRYPDYDASEAVRAMQNLMLKFLGQYGYRNIAKVAWSRMLGLRLLWSWSTDDYSNGHRPPHCSDSASRCDQVAGVDPVPNTPSWATTPADFGRSLLYEYQYTLYWSVDQIPNTEEMAA